MNKNSKTPKTLGTGSLKADDRLSTLGAAKTVSFQRQPTAHATRREVSLHDPAAPPKNFARKEQVLMRKGVAVGVSPVKSGPQSPAEPRSDELDALFRFTDRKEKLVPLLTAEDVGPYSKYDGWTRKGELTYVTVVLLYSFSLAGSL